MARKNLGERARIHSAKFTRPPLLRPFCLIFSIVVDPRTKISHTRITEFKNYLDFHGRITMALNRSTKLFDYFITNIYQQSVQNVVHYPRDKQVKNDKLSRRFWNFDLSTKFKVFLFFPQLSSKNVIFIYKTLIFIVDVRIRCNLLACDSQFKVQMLRANSKSISNITRYYYIQTTHIHL